MEGDLYFSLSGRLIFEYMCDYAFGKGTEWDGARSAAAAAGECRDGGGGLVHSLFCGRSGAGTRLVWRALVGEGVAGAVGGVRFSGFDVSGVLELAGSPGPHVQPAGCGCVDG